MRKLQRGKAVERRKRVISENEIKADSSKSIQELIASFNAGYVADEMVRFKEILNDLRIAGVILQQENAQRRRHVRV